MAGVKKRYFFPSALWYMKLFTIILNGFAFVNRFSHGFFELLRRCQQLLGPVQHGLGELLAAGEPCQLLPALLAYIDKL